MSREVRVGNGIYLTDYRRRVGGGESESRGGNGEEPTERQLQGSGILGHGKEVAVEILENQIEELEKQIGHLQRSNAEMMEEDPRDPDFVEAIEENAVVIDKKLVQVSDLRQELAALHPHASSKPEKPHPAENSSGFFL